MLKAFFSLCASINCCTLASVGLDIYNTQYITTETVALTRKRHAQKQLFYNLNS